MLQSKFTAAVIAISAIVGISAASAADLAPRPYTKAPPMVAPVYSWTGCYVGVEGGGVWGRSQHINNDPLAAGFGLPQTNGIDLSGGMAGGTVGCNYQFAGNWVVGIEGDLSWTDTSGTSPAIAPFVLADTFSTSQRWMDTVRGRIGYAWDRVLVYGTGGAAFTGEHVQICGPTLGVGFGCSNATNSVAGWTAGAGLEWAFYQNWSAKIEYLHADFGTHGFPTLPNTGGGTFAARNVTLTDDLVRVGVNYRFNWGGPVVARY